MDKNQSSEMSQKIVSWAKWAILARLGPKMMQAYITGSAQRIFFLTFQPDRAQ